MDICVCVFVCACVYVSLARRWVAYGQVSYPTVLLFKSSKIIVVMFSAVIILRKSFLPAEYAASLLAVTGLYTFSRADLTFKASTEDRGDTVHGVTVMLCAVGCEALVSTLQEYCLRKLHRPLAELICITNSLGAVLLVSVSLVHGDAAELRARLSTSVQPVVWVLGAVTLAYGGTYAFTSCIMGFGAVVATGLGIIRKLLSVVLSFLLFPKPFGVAHAAGLGIFFSGLVVAWTVDWDKHGAVEGKVPQTVQGGYAELSQEAEGGENLRPRRQISHSHSHEKMEGERVMLERSRHGIITNLGSEVPAGPGS